MLMVRDGQKVSPYCPECGCRLEEGVNDFFHFGYWEHNGKDAAGCRCLLIDYRFTQFDTGWHQILATQTLNWKPI